MNFVVTRIISASLKTVQTFNYLLSHQSTHLIHYRTTFHTNHFDVLKGNRVPRQSPKISAGRRLERLLLMSNQARKRDLKGSTCDKRRKDTKICDKKKTHIATIFFVNGTRTHDFNLI